jgi:hypothetical protein
MENRWPLVSKKAAGPHLGGPLNLGGSGGAANEPPQNSRKSSTIAGLCSTKPIAALAPLGLARAYVLQGDTAKARAAYHDFLTLWKDADPDIPVLIAAKAEYAKLN